MFRGKCDRAYLHFSHPNLSCPTNVRSEANETCALEGATLVQVDNEFTAYFLGDRFVKMKFVNHVTQVPHFWIDSKVDVNIDGWRF